MVWPSRLAFVLLFISASAGAQDLPAQQPSSIEQGIPAQEALAEKPEIPDQPAVPIRSVVPEKPAPKPNFFLRPFYDSHILILAEINTGAAVWDDVASRRIINRGGFERNPLMRPFVHNPGTLAGETIAEVWLVSYVADRMKRSSHPVLRKNWWLPQALNITAKLYGGINSTAILSRHQ
jgi:hypothetical protein